jgi:hypothetical protein
VSNFTPVIALDAFGSTLYVWQSLGPEIVEIHSRFYSGAGSSAGERAITVDPGSRLVYPSSPAVTASPGGDYWAAWTSFDTIDRSCHGVQVAADGSVVGHEEQWNEGAESDHPSIGVRSDGSLVASWQTVGEGTNEIDIRVRDFDANGNPASLETTVNTSGLCDFCVNFVSEIGIFPGGSALVVWQRDLTSAGGDIKVRGRYVDAEGVPRGDEFAIAEQPNNQFYPDVACDGLGRCLVVWSSAIDHATNLEVFGQYFGADGSRLGPVFVVNQSLPGAQWEARVAANRFGDFAVIWQDVTDAVNLDGRAFHGLGIAYGDVFRVESVPSTSEDKEVPETAISDSGRIVFAWEGGFPTTLPQVRARNYVLPCVADERTACLGEGGRYLVRATWRTASGDSGLARSVPLAAESNGFWFFDEENLELVVKVLDGCGVNGRHWIYASGLTNVGVQLLVTDTWTGEVWSHENPLGTAFPPVQDILALGGCEATSPAGSKDLPTAAPIVAARDSAALPRSLDSCAGDATHLCLHGGRFRVSATYDSGTGLAGEAQASPLLDDGGTFWFFWSDNLELFVKVLDACDPFGKFWVYAAGLTDVEVRLTVEDTATGALRQYTNPLGTPFQPIQDVAAFSTCP